MAGKIIPILLAIVFLALISPYPDQYCIISIKSYGAGEYEYMLDYSKNGVSMCIVLPSAEHLDRYVEYLDKLGSVSWLDAAK